MADSRQSDKPRRQLVLNAFVTDTVAHLSPGLWKHPRNQTTEYKTLQFWTKLAQLLDEEGIHAINCGCSR